MRASPLSHFGWCLLLAITFVVPSMALACPNCKDAIAGDPVAAALSWTTLLLIAVPLVLFGSIGGWVGFIYWRAAHGLPWNWRWTGKESET